MNSAGRLECRRGILIMMEDEEHGDVSESTVALVSRLASAFSTQDADEILSCVQEIKVGDAWRVDEGGETNFFLFSLYLKRMRFL